MKTSSKISHLRWTRILRQSINAMFMHPQKIVISSRLLPNGTRRYVIAGSLGLLSFTRDKLVEEIRDNHWVFYLENIRSITTLPTLIRGVRRIEVICSDPNVTPLPRKAAKKVIKSELKPESLEEQIQRTDRLITKLVAQRELQIAQRNLALRVAERKSRSGTNAILTTVKSDAAHISLRETCKHLFGNGDAITFSGWSASKINRKDLVDRALYVSMDYDVILHEVPGTGTLLEFKHI